MVEKQLTFGKVRDIPKNLYPELAVEILRSFRERKYDKQEILHNFFELAQKNTPERFRPRDWKVLNQKHEMQDLYAWELISEAVNSLDIQIQERKGAGRPSANPYDLLKFAILKTYQLRSFRRSNSFNMLYARCFTTKMIKRSRINQVYNDIFFTPYFEQLYRKIADYLIPFENSFAVDSTGFGTRYNHRWVKVRLDFQRHRSYKKLHAICGVNTHIITEASITNSSINDSPLFPELVEKTAQRFSIHRVCADAGYLSGRNAQVVEEIGGLPFIMPRQNSTGRNSNTPAYKRMVKAYKHRTEEWKKEYHLRQQIEVVFSQMKTTLLGGLNCRKEISQKNELLIRVICHNISVLIEAIFRFGITPFDK